MQAEPQVGYEEVELILKIGQGDRNSFAEFYEKFSAVIVSTAFRVLNDHRDAEDVAQEVFSMIWEKASLYDPARGKPLTWVVTMTRNKSIDRLRSLQRRFRLRDELEKESDSGVVQMERAPFEEADAFERGKMVRSAVKKLSKEQREVIEMAYFSGLTQNEIAEELKQPLGTIKARIRRGMIKLRRLVASPY